MKEIELWFNERYENWRMPMNEGPDWGREVCFHDQVNEKLLTNGKD